MRRLSLHSAIGVALASLVASACYVTTTTDPSRTGAQTSPPPEEDPRTERRTTPPPRKQPAPPATDPDTRPRDVPARDVDVRDWRRRRIGSAAAFEIEPTAGPVGTVINIYGRFRPAVRKGGPVMCSFTGAPQVSPYFVSTRRLTLIVPQGARSGPVRCTIGNRELWAGRFSVTRKLDNIFVPTDEEQGLLGAVYKLSPNTKRLPDFSTLGEPVSTFVVPTLSVGPRSFDVGFPLLSTGGEPLLEWFAIRFTGIVEATKTTDYTFRLVSDDGAKLYINDQLVIDNDGIHPPRAKEGTIRLTEGKHDIVVEYFQGPRNQIALELWWKRDNNPFSGVPAKSLSRYTVEHDCSEKPAMMCCQGQSPACQECRSRAAQALADWESACAPN